MDAGKFASCFVPGDTVAEAAQRLADAFPKVAGMGDMAAFAAALIDPYGHFPEMTLTAAWNHEYMAALAVLKAQVDWSTMQVRPERARRRVTSPASQDMLATLHPLGQWGMPAFLTHVASCLVRPTRRAAVVVTCRDDGISLLEWVAHYRAVGFEGIFVYSNDNADGSDALLAALAEQGVITYIENRTEGGVSPQHKAFAHALHFLPELRDFEWVFFADSDEFLIPDGRYDYSIRAMLDDVAARYPAEAPSSICVHWQWMNSNWKRRRERAPLLERFAFGRKHDLVKSIVRLANVLTMRVLHFPTLNAPGFYIDDDLARIPDAVPGAEHPVWKHHSVASSGCRLNHYWCKSFDEFLIKKRRGDLVLTDKKNMYSREFRLFFQWNGPDRPEDHVPPPAGLVARGREGVAGLRALPGVTAGESAVEAGFEALLRSIGTADEIAALYEASALEAGMKRVRGAAQQADRPGVPALAGMLFSDVLRDIVIKLRPKAYLSIGLAGMQTLELVECTTVLVDSAAPAQTSTTVGGFDRHTFKCRSEVFFGAFDVVEIFGRRVDVAFLGGDKSCAAVLRQFMQVERACRQDSVIVLQNCLPTDLHMARADPDDVARAEMSAFPDIWAGDVWKVPLILRRWRPDLAMLCVDSPPTGLVMVSNLDPGSTRLGEVFAEAVAGVAPLTLAEYGVGRLHEEARVRPTAQMWRTEVVHRLAMA